MSHYSIGTVDAITDLVEVFGADPRPNAYQYLIGSTSGVHGSYTTLNEIEACYAGACDCEPDRHEGSQWRLFTVLLIQPRLVRLRYGVLDLDAAEIPYLRLLITRSMEVIRESQIDNCIG